MQGPIGSEDSKNTVIADNNLSSAPQNPCGEIKYRPDQFKKSPGRIAQYPKRQYQKPDDRIQEKRQYRQGPADQ